MLIIWLMQLLTFESVAFEGVGEQTQLGRGGGG